MSTTSTKTIFFNAQSYEDTMWGVDSAKTSGTSSYMATKQHAQNGSQWFVFKWTPALMQAQIPSDATSVNVQAYITAKTSKGYGEVRIAEARMGYGQPSSLSDANNYTALHTTSGYIAVGGSSWATKPVTDYKSASVSTLRNSGLYLACRLRNYGGTWGWVQEVHVAECFASITYTQPSYYALTVNASTGGTVTGGGTYVENTAVTIKASPNTGYKFTKWSDGNTNATRSVTVTSAATYTAYFEKLTYTVTATAGTGGTVSGGGTYEYGTSVTLTATPSEGYKFVQWSDGNTNATRTFTVTGNVSLTASFSTTNLNNIYVGTKQTSGVYIGTTKAKAVYVGTTKIYE